MQGSRVWGLRAWGLALTLTLEASAFSPSALSTQSLGPSAPQLPPARPLSTKHSALVLKPAALRTPVPSGRGAEGLRLSSAAVGQQAPAPVEKAGDSLPAWSRMTTFDVKGKQLNLPMFMLFLAGAFGWAILLFPFISLAYAWDKVFDPYRRKAVDAVVRVWAIGATLILLYWPKLSGAENLPQPDEGVMYIPNHSSFLDIFTLSGAIPRRFKYVSKQEVLDVPIIGWAMKMAGHIGIRRMDKRSQLQTFKETVDVLKSGASIVTFAEGTRSADGRLKKFKKGPIKMAQKAGVKIVPVSICNVYKWMPSEALAPLAPPQAVEIKIHPAIDTKGKSEDEILDYVFSAVNSGLPDFQKCEAPESLGA